MEIKVAIVEDDQELVDSYKVQLQDCTDIVIVATAFTASQAVQQFPEANPNVVIVDLVLPDTKNRNLIAELSAVIPNAQLLVVSAHEDYESIYRAILSGAVGYISKLSPDTDLATTIRSVYNGESPISSTIARKILIAFQVNVNARENPHELTKREIEVLHLISTGRSYYDCADALHLSLETVRTHVRNAYKKLQIKSKKDIPSAMGGRL